MKNPLTSSCLETITTTVGALSDLDARAISASLTRAGSSFQVAVMNRDGTRTPIVLIRDGATRVVSWAASRRIHGIPTLEGFTLAERRRQGLFAAAVTLLVAGGHLDRSSPVAVFTVESMACAVDLKFTDVRLYHDTGDGQRLALAVSTSPLRWSPPGESRPQG
jgi:hypothetical protein